MQTNVFDNDKEVLGGEINQKKEIPNFNGELLIMEYNSIDYHNYWNTKNKEYLVLPQNNFKSGEDFAYSITKEDEFLYSEPQEFKDMIATQLLKWKTSLKKEGQDINDIEITDDYLFNQMYFSIGFLAGLVDSFDGKSIFSILLDSSENVRANEAVVSRFKQNKADDYYPEEPIQKFFRDDDKTKLLISSFEKRFKELLVKYNFDMEKINIYNDWKKGIDYKHIPDFKFNPSIQRNSTKAIQNLVVGGVQGMRFYLKKLAVKQFSPDLRRGIREVNFNYSAELELQFIDDFGLNWTDIGKTQTSDILKKLGTPYLIAFWILQHQRGYKPFANIIKIPFESHGVIKDPLL